MYPPALIRSVLLVCTYITLQDAQVFEKMTATVQVVKFMRLCPAGDFRAPSRYRLKVAYQTRPMLDVNFDGYHCLWLLN